MARTLSTYLYDKITGKPQRFRTAECFRTDTGASVGTAISDANGRVQFTGLSNGIQYRIITKKPGDQTVLDERDKPASSTDWYNVKNYGATGLSTTPAAEETAAIQAAFDACAVAQEQYLPDDSTSGHVHFPAGFYNINAPLDMPQGVLVTGDGKNATIINNTANSDGFRCDPDKPYGARRITIRDMQIRGLDRDVATAGCAIRIWGGDTADTASARVGSFHLENILIYGGYDGVLVADSFGASELNNVRVDYVAHHGFLSPIHDGQSQAYCTGIVFSGCAANYCYGDGFHINMQYPAFISCWANNCGPFSRVDATSAAGQMVLNVASTVPFSVGDSVTIMGASDARCEIRTIGTIQAGVSLTLTENLAYEHTAAQADVVIRNNPFSQVDATSASGQKVLNVAATTSFAVGDCVNITSSTNTRVEFGIIDTIQVGISLTLVGNLTYTHTDAQADYVVNLTTATPVGGDGMHFFRDTWGSPVTDIYSGRVSLISCNMENNSGRAVFGDYLRGLTISGGLLAPSGLLMGTHCLEIKHARNIVIQGADLSARGGYALYTPDSSLGVVVAGSSVYGVAGSYSHPAIVTTIGPASVGGTGVSQALVNIGSTPVYNSAVLSVNGGAHFGGYTDPGDNNVLVDGWLGLSDTPTTAGQVWAETAGVAHRFTRNTTTVGSGASASLSVRRKCNADVEMVDGYAARVQFVLVDAQAVENINGVIDLERDGADNTGSFSLKTTSGGTTLTERLRLDNTGAQIAGILQGSQLKSTVAVGTAPLIVTSTTMVSNLNADLLDGLHASSFLSGTATDAYTQTYDLTERTVTNLTTASILDIADLTATLWNQMVDDVRTNRKLINSLIDDHQAWGICE